MNPLARGVHKNLDSKSYRRMKNEFEGTKHESQPLQGRLRLGNRRKKSVPEPCKGPPQASEMDRNDDSFHQRWTGKFPSEFSSRHEPMQRRLMTDAESVVSRTGDESLISHGESTDVAVRPTISKPSPQHLDHHQLINHHAQRAGSATIVSTNSFESLDKVEKASITSPGIHCQQWNRNRMSKQRMLSEKTINTINTQGTMNTNTTTGTGMHTVTTADSTLLSSITSMHSVSAPAMLTSTTEFSATSPGFGNSARPSFRSNQSNYSPNGSMTLRQVTLPTYPTHSRRQKSEDQDLYDKSLSDETTSPMGMSPDANETEEDRMMRLALEMSLRDFEEQQQRGGRGASLSSGIRQPMASTTTRKLQHSNEVCSPRPTHSQQQHRSSVMQSPSPVEQQEMRDRLHEFARQPSQQSLLTIATKEELTEVQVENHRGIQRNRRSSRKMALLATPEKPRVATNPNTGGGSHRNDSAIIADPSVARQLEFARAHLSKDEADAIERALLGDVLSSGLPPPTSARPTPSALEHPPQEHRRQFSSALHLSDSEAAEIEKAIREADEEEQKRSLSMALRVSAEEANRGKSVTHPRTHGAVGTGESHRSSSPSRSTQALHQSDEWDPYPMVNDQDHGKNRSNMTYDSIDRFVRVNDVDAETDLAMLGIEADEDIAFVGNTAYNAFKQCTDRPSGVGKASPLHTRDLSDAVTHTEARLPNQIASAVRTGLIEQCNGIVKQGEEADVYHAEQGTGQ